MFFMVVSIQVNCRQEGCMTCMFVALLNKSWIWYISEYTILYLPAQDCDSKFWAMAPNMCERIINIYSISVRFCCINLVAEVHVVYRTVLAFHITTNIMLHAFLFTQTQWNKDSYSIKVVVSGYHSNDTYQRYMKICNPQRAVFGVSFCSRRLGNEVSLHWQTHFSFYWQKLNLNKNICCTKVRLPTLILWTDTQIISYDFQFVHCFTFIFRTPHCTVI